MDYSITCICGYRFILPEERVQGTVSCPSCNQRLSPIIDTAPSVPKATPPTGPAPSSSENAAAPPPPLICSGVTMARAEEAKRCPFCGEVILAIARKCKHCGEFLDRLSPGSGPAGGASRPSGASDSPPVFAVSVSQWDNFWKYLILLTVSGGVALGLYYLEVPYAMVAIPGIFVLAGFVAWYFHLVARHTRYYVRPMRIDSETGILTKDNNTLELFRITDLELKQNVVERLLGIGTITLITSDPSSPRMQLYQISQARPIYTYIKTQIPMAARRRGAVIMNP